MITQRSAIEIAVALFKSRPDEEEGPAWYQYSQNCKAVLGAIREDNPKVDARQFYIYCGFQDNYFAKATSLQRSGEPK